MMLASTLTTAAIVAAAITVCHLTRRWWQHRRRAMEWSAHRAALRTLGQGPCVMPRRRP